MFQAQKLMADTQVASARFTLRRAPVSGIVAVPTVSGNHSGRRLGAVSVKDVAAHHGGRYG
jgi:hypothetical protein